MKRYYLRGTVAGFVIGLLVIIVQLIVNYSTVPCSMIAGSYCPQGLAAVLQNIEGMIQDNPLKSTLAIVALIAVPMILCTIIWWVIGKSRNETGLVINEVR